MTEQKKQMMEPRRYVFEGDEDALIRDGLILALFFQRPFVQVCEGVRQVLDLWLEIIPEDCLAWYHGSSSWAYKPLRKSTLGRCRGMLKPERVATQKFTGFELFSEPQLNPDYLFDIVGDTAIDSDKPDWTSLLELRFPTEFLQSFGVENWLRWVIRVSELIDYDSGYSAIGLNCFQDDSEMLAERFIPGLALRHHGYDISRNNSTRFSLGQRSRGARWLTLLGPHPLEKLGGEEKLSAQLDPAIEVLQAGQGLLLRAGEMPETGDVNRDQDLPLLRSVARAIEPVTFFGDEDVHRLLAWDYDQNPEILERWERRFLD